MKKNVWLGIAISCLLCLHGVAMAAEKVPFLYNNLASAKQRASEQGKLCMVVFTASWCQPCHWMEKNTFQHPELSNFVEKNVVAVKVDIDDFDGYVYKEQYDVKVLPTIMIFNAKGKLIERREEASSGADLLAALKKYHSGGTASPTLPAPKKPVVTETKPASPAAPPVVSKPAAPAKDNVKTTPKKPTVEMMKGEGLYRLDLSRQPSKGFSIQIGVYSQYENVLKEVERLKHLFQMPTIVHVDKIDGKNVYKMMVGEFKTAAEAEAYLKKMKDRAVDGIVKDMAYMK